MVLPMHSASGSGFCNPFWDVLQLECPSSLDWIRVIRMREHEVNMMPSLWNTTQNNGDIDRISNSATIAMCHTWFEWYPYTIFGVQPHMMSDQLFSIHFNPGHCSCNKSECKACKKGCSTLVKNYHIWQYNEEMRIPKKEFPGFITSKGLILIISCLLYFSLTLFQVVDSGLFSVPCFSTCWHLQKLSPKQMN